MSKILTLTLILCLAAHFILPGSVVAQEPALGSKEDNDCNTGGAMASQCTTEWHWICGWYLARWKEAGGWGGVYRFPTWCESLLPPRPVVSAEASAADFPIGDCRFLGVGYVNFGAGFSLPTGSPFYFDALCTNPTGGTTAAPLVYAPLPFNPVTLCFSAFGLTIPNLTGTDIYVCN